MAAVGGGPPRDGGGRGRRFVAMLVQPRLQLDGRKHLGPSADDLFELIELGCSAPLLPRRRARRRVTPIAFVLLRVIGRE